MSLSTGINNWEVALHNWNPSGRKKILPYTGVSRTAGFSRKRRTPIFSIFYQKRWHCFNLLGFWNWSLESPDLYYVYIRWHSSLKVLLWINVKFWYEWIADNSNNIVSDPRSTRPWQWRPAMSSNHEQNFESFIANSPGWLRRNWLPINFLGAFLDFSWSHRLFNTKEFFVCSWNSPKFDTDFDLYSLYSWITAYAPIDFNSFSTWTFLTFVYIFQAAATFTDFFGNWKFVKFAGVKPLWDVWHPNLVIAIWPNATCQNPLLPDLGIAQMTAVLRLIFINSSSGSDQGNQE